VYLPEYKDVIIPSLVFCALYTLYDKVLVCLCILWPATSFAAVNIVYATLKMKIYTKIYFAESCLLHLEGINFCTAET
jgi:hypothetical protein